MSTVSRRIFVFLVFPILAIRSADVVADIYVSRDLNGRLIYSDRKPSGTFKTVRIESHPSTVAASSASAAAASSSWQQQETARQEKAQVAERERLALIEERAKRCSTAKKLGAHYALDGPRCSYDENGQRSCLSAAEIDSKRDEAKRQIAEYCDR